MIIAPSSSIPIFNMAAEILCKSETEDTLKDKKVESYFEKERYINNKKNKLMK